MWCAFARAFTIERSLGCSSRSGAAVLARVGSKDKPRILYEAKAFSNDGTPNRGATILERYREPTWGDIDKLAKILTGLGLSDASILETAILSNRGTVSHLQVTRNACAHRSLQSLKAVRKLQPFYVIRDAIRHPSDLAWQEHASDKSTAILRWITDVELLADLMTNIP